MGVKPENFIVAKDVEAVVKKWSRTFDIILITAFGDDLPMDTLYLPLLKSVFLMSH